MRRHITARQSGHAGHDEPADSSRRFSARSLLFLFAASVYLYLIFFVHPFIPIGGSNDGLIYLTAARRMLEGEVLYRDFFEFVTPGTPLLFLVLFKIFGPCLWIPNATLVAVGLAYAWFALLIARRTMSLRVAFLPAAAYVVLAFGGHATPTHHWFSVLPAVAAIAVLIEKRTPVRITAAGALCGLSLCLTQNRGFMALLGVGVFLLWEWRHVGLAWTTWLKQELLLLAGAFAMVVGVNAYFVWNAGLERFFYCTVVFVSRYYSANASFGTLRAFTADLPALTTWRDLASAKSWFLFNALIPLIYILFLVRYLREARKRPQEPWDRLMLVALVGFSLYLSVAPAPALYRIAAGSLPAFVLLGWFLDSHSRLDRTLAVLMWAGVLVTSVTGVLNHQRHWRGILVTPQGSVALLNQAGYEKYRWFQQHTQNGEFLFEPAEDDLYFYLGLRNPAPIPLLLNTAYTRPEQVREVIRSLETRRVRYVAWWSDELDYYPPGADPRGDNLWPLRDYLRKRYHVVKVFGRTELVYQRNE